jgi:hypothetical protein
MADARISVWDAKFKFSFWRPFSAIPLVGDDGNAFTTADAAWKSLVLTPNHQEYPSGHGGLSGAAARVLASIFGDRTSFTHRTDTAPFRPAHSPALLGRGGRGEQLARLRRHPLPLRSPRRTLDWRQRRQACHGDPAAAPS